MVARRIGLLSAMFNSLSPAAVLIIKILLTRFVLPAIARAISGAARALLPRLRDGLALRNLRFGPDSRCRPPGFDLTRFLLGRSRNNRALIVAGRGGHGCLHLPGLRPIPLYFRQ